MFNRSGFEIDCLLLTLDQFESGLAPLSAYKSEIIRPNAAYKRKVVPLIGDASASNPNGQEISSSLFTERYSVYPNPETSDTILPPYGSEVVCW